MLKKLLCAALIAVVMTACGKEEAIVEPSKSETATVHLSVSPFEILTKNTDPNNDLKKHIDSIKIIDVFIFRESGVLDAYKHFSITDVGGMNLSDLQINATVGNRTIYVIANAKETSWAGVTTESKLLSLPVMLQDEFLRNFTMSAKITLDLQESQTVNVVLKKLIAKVIVNGVKTDFANGPYEGVKLRNVRMYLTNISGAKNYLGEEPENKVILNKKGYSAEDYEGCLMTALFAEGVPGLVGDDGYTTTHHFYCYENLLESETDTDKFTRLVLEANLDGKTYYYPVDINRPGYGWNSSIDHKGVKRNTCYTFSFTITGPGTDDPEDKIVLKTIKLDATVEDLVKSPYYLINF
ncbi:MAG: hypothetical protein J6X91_02350 [Bacteroidales bacterium]|nr:hypothetical protein [Bacteroidales bacterium]